MATEFFRTKSKRTIRFLFLNFVSIFIEMSSRAHIKNRGQRMAVYANDFIGININNFGFYEHEHLNILFKFLEKFDDIFKNSIAMDIGANIGNHSIFFSKRFSQVIAFEPNPNTFKILELNSSWSRNISPINVGLGDSAGIFKMREEIDNFGASTVMKPTDLSNASELIDIKLDTLDQYVGEIENVSLIKIDVEGHEYAVLKGGQQFILANKPIIIFEQHLDDFVNGRNEVISLLQDTGYQIFWHRSGVDSQCRMLRLASNVLELIIGRKHTIMSDQNIPAQFHHMLIAIPTEKLRILENI